MDKESVKSLAAGMNTAIENYDPSDVFSREAVLRQASSLMRAVATPSDLWSIHMSNMMEVVALNTLLNFKVFQHLPETGSISLDDLSAKINADPALIRRLLSQVVACEMVQQLPDLTYTSTRFSKAYSTDFGPGNAFNMIFEETFMCISHLPAYLREKGLHDPTSQFTSPFAWHAQKEGISVWEVLADQPERISRFQRAMPAFYDRLPRAGFYDFPKLVDTTSEDRPALVDVGGGIGGGINAILAKHPEMPPDRFIIQDLPPVIAEGEEAKKRGVLPKEVKLMAHDFNTAQPVKGAKAYYFKLIFHDYSDDVCISILKRIVPAMSADSVVLISDFILPDRITSADIDATTAGITLIVMAGKERTRGEFKAILEAAGLEMVGVHVPVAGNFGIVEARLPASAAQITNGSH